MELTVNTRVTIRADPDARFHHPDPAAWLFGREPWELLTGESTVRLKWLPAQNVGVLTVSPFGDVLMVPGLPYVPLPNLRSQYALRCLSTIQRLCSVGEAQATKLLAPALAELLAYLVVPLCHYSPSLFPPGLRAEIQSGGSTTGEICRVTRPSQASTSSSPRSSGASAASSGGGTITSSTPKPSPGGRRPKGRPTATRRNRKSKS